MGFKRYESKQINKAFPFNESTQLNSVLLKQTENDCTVGECKNTDNKKERDDQQETHMQVIIRITIIPETIKTRGADNKSES